MEFLKESPYKVKLEIFCGPLDLLLHLIHKNELDVYDIEISLITKQYMEYLDLLKDLNINVAGEFLVMASTLTEIKSKMLLPSPQPESQNPEEIGSGKNDLIQRLLLYKKYKEAAIKFDKMSLLGRDTFKRMVTEEYCEENIELDIFTLMDAFLKIKQNLSQVSEIEVKIEEFSVKEAISIISDRIEQSKMIRFVDIFFNIREYGKLIAFFLAILEMMKMGQLVVRRENEELFVKSANFN